MANHCSAKTYEDAGEELARMIERKTRGPRRRELYKVVLTRPYCLLAQAEEELSLFGKYLRESGISDREISRYLSNLSHCIGTSVGNIKGNMIP